MKIFEEKIKIYSKKFVYIEKNYYLCTKIRKNMGCFNSNGFFSNQEITAGAKCVGFICVTYDNVKEYPGFTFKTHKVIPIALPIFGKYNDYGYICDIKHTRVTDDIEKAFGLTIEEFVDIIFTMSKAHGDRYTQVKEIVRKIQSGEETCYTMDNYFMKAVYEKYLPIRQKVFDHFVDHEDSFITKFKERLNDCTDEDEREYIKDRLHRLEEEYAKDPVIKENFDIFLCIDHECLWNVFSEKSFDMYYYQKEYEKRVSYLKNYAGARYGDRNEEDSVYTFFIHDCMDEELKPYIDEAYNFFFNTFDTLVLKPHRTGSQEKRPKMWMKYNQALADTYAELTKRYGYDEDEENNIE